MCLCNGDGGIAIERTWGIEYQPCPDTNCQFDREESDRKYNDWWEKVNEYFTTKGYTSLA